MQTNEVQQLRSCRGCGERVPSNAVFCPTCGIRLDNPFPRHLFGVKLLSLATALTAITWGFIWYQQGTLIGTPPTEVYRSAGFTDGHTPHGDAEQYTDPDLERMKQAAQAAGTDGQLWREVANKAVEKIRSGVFSPQRGTLEAIDALSQALQIDQNDQAAILMMADLSFEQRAFAKAVEFYRRYLDLVPNSVDVRARYASTLTFVGEYQQAIGELTGILIDHPDNFQAKAFLAIAYAQNGDTDKARILGNEALQNAPSDTARARLGIFVDSLNADQERDSDVSVQQSSVTTPFPNKLAAYLKSNPVAGPKFVDYDYTAGKFTAYFQNFPMEQMPPFAKEKFFTGIREFLKGEESDKPVSVVIFKDIATKSEMAKLTP